MRSVTRAPRATQVLVVGAGPTGLALSLQAFDHGAHVRIVDRRREAFRPSRALIVHPRTLEVLHPLGVTEQLLARADTAPEAQLHVGSREVQIHLGELALADTPFPHLSLMRQMDVETVLANALAARGVEVERGTELLEVSAEGRDGDGDGDGYVGAQAALQSCSAIEHAVHDFVVGCDGPESTVRRAVGIGWHGGPYGQEVVLADLELDADLARGVAHVVVGRRGLLFLFALGERATWRLLATQPARPDPPPFGEPGPPVPPTHLQALLDVANLDARIIRVVWSGRYPLQHRLATQLRQGRLFLAGDAAHAYSPATGQGMNTGIQDAINLGWKLAFAASASDRTALLDSYDRERRPVARQTLTMTPLAFWGEASTRSLPSLLRGSLAPLVAPLVPALINLRRPVAEIVRWISQLRVAYPDSLLSVEGTPRLLGGPRPGHRLPDATVTIDGRRVRVHALLAQPGVHVLLQRDARELERQSLGQHVTVHRVTSVPGTGLLAVRPDGYVGFRCGNADSGQLESWLARIGACRLRTYT